MSSASDPETEMQQPAAKRQKKKSSLVTLAHPYERYGDKINVKDGSWLVSEKLDGLRGFVDLAAGEIMSRTGKTFSVPPKYKEMILEIGLPLDGELFCGRGNFDQASSVVRKKIGIEKEWETLTFQVFDFIDENRTFAERYEILKTKIPADHPFIKLVEQTVVQQTDDLDMMLDDAVKIGCEGLMLKDGSSHYEFKRSKSILKLKRMQDDEAIVLVIEKGKGKNSERMGQVVCRWKNNDVEFKVGTGFSDEQRENPPFKKGDIITVKFFELTKTGAPRFPVFKCVRNDNA